MSRHYPNAELHMGLAAELNENDPWTLISTALFHSFVEQHDRAEAQCRRAGEVAGAVSRLHWVYQSTIEFLRGDYECCVTSGVHSGDAIVSNIAWRAAAHWHLGQAEEARTSLQKFFAAARTRLGPPMSISSTRSSKLTSLRAAVLTNGYKLTTTRSISVMPCAAAAVRSSAWLRRARMPPCTLG